MLWYAIRTCGNGYRLFVFVLVEQIYCRIGSDNMENENMNEEKQYENFKRLVENTDFWNTFVHIEGSDISAKRK